MTDRVGIGWRGELAAGIMANLDRIDVLEVIADDWFHASRPRLRALRRLARSVPVTLHGVGLGLAGSAVPPAKRLERMARLADAVVPESWSEHLAFVRAGGIEIGHLAAPPRTEAGILAAVRNVAQAARVVGAAPLLENIATLVEPPGSTLSETEWVGRIVSVAGGGLLLDLHNLYANAVNFGRDPETELLRLPLRQVSSVHLSGGHWILEPGGGGRRLLDDHVHDVPPPVFGLLTTLARHAPQPLTVILERDGAYPDFRCLLAQLEATRAALRRGRMAVTACQGAA